jgi:hypothetical protein
MKEIGPVPKGAPHRRVAARIAEARLKLRTLVPLLAVLALGPVSACKENTASPPLIPKGFGVIVVFVQDESGKPVQGATVQIINRDFERAELRTDSEGRTKGAGEIRRGPFAIRVTAPGYAEREAWGVHLREGQTVPLAIKLKKR